MTGAAARFGDRGLVIEFAREFRAAPERVFRRWTEADALARWFAPPGYTTVYCESDPRPGGRWRLEFRARTGRHHYGERGSFHEVDPFERLAFTLTQVDGQATNPETFVTVDFEDIGTADAPRTMMRFAQSGYRSRALREDNEQGWRGCFTALAEDLHTGKPS